MEPMSFVVACRNFFGQKPGQSLTEFQAELKALTPQDRREIAEGLSKELQRDVKP